MNRDARHIAFDLLRAAGDPRNTLDRAIDRAAPDLAALSSRDRNLCNAIVFGTLRHQGQLDHLIRHFSKAPFDRIDQKTLTLLRMAAFQICFLDRVPDFAAIDTATDLAKKVMGRKVTGFVNGLLRQLAREHGGISLPDRKKQFPAFLKVTYSIPNWLGKRWTGEYGRKGAETLGRQLMEIPPLTLRINPLKTDISQVAALLDEEKLPYAPARLSPLGIHLKNPGKHPGDLPGFDRGFFQVQDEAAQLAVQLLDPKPGEEILDACAGLGGKACHAAQLMEDKGGVTAVDIEPGKLAPLDTEARRLGITIIKTAGLDITRATVKDFDGYFDRVLVDAPCTGLGVIRRNPDTRWKRTARDILRMAALQKKILNAAASLVRPGGVLVYAVCSCEPEENQGVTDAFLERRKDFMPDTGAINRLIPGPGISEPAFWFKTFPDPGDMDGFFVARMRRK